MKYILFLALYALCSCTTSLVVTHGDDIEEKFEDPKDYCRLNDSLYVDGTSKVGIYDLSSVKYINGNSYTIGAIFGGVVGIVPSFYAGVLASMITCDDDALCSVGTIILATGAGTILLGNAAGNLLGSEKVELSKIKSCNMSENQKLSY